MDALAAADAFLFENFRLDRHGLSRCDDQGCFVPVPVGLRALEVLNVMVARSGDLVARDEIMNVVWPGIVVESSNLPVQIAALRRVLDDGRARGSCIQTIPGRGYRFVAPVVRANSACPPVALLPSGKGVDEDIAADEQLQGRPGILAHPDELPARASRRQPRPGMIAGVTGILFLVAAGVVGWHLRSSGSDETRPAPRLSIVVLPFANLSSDPEQQYFANGITEDLTTALSQIPDMFVISANTAFTYRNTPVDTKRFGHELGVRYVLEGSFQRSANRVRINAQLIDAETDAHLWAEGFDRDIADLFALQDEITSRIAIALNLELTSREAIRPTDNPDALDYILRARAEIYKPRSLATIVAAIDLLERALSLDPGSVEAKSLLATILLSRVLDFGSSSKDADMSRAEQLAAEAVAAAPRNPFSHYAKAEVLRVRRRCAEVIPEYETVLATNRNWVAAMANLGRCKIWRGPVEEGIATQEHAIQLSPRDPNIWSWSFRIGEGDLLLSHIEDAVVWLEKARNGNPAPDYIHAYLAAAYALAGDTEEAATELSEARRLGGQGSYSRISQLRARTRYETQTTRDLCEATFFAGLRKAGVPEE
jgi:TolB-like protein/DNA-binding winged helix-turn-helix (wHTH) protein